MVEREKIAARIRALRAKTIENGCTEQEAMSAAETLARLLAKYNMTLDEAELRSSPFEKHSEEHSDWAGERLWKVADGVAHLTGARYWQSRPGVFPIEISFFGFAHEVEVARYMLEICARAMRGQQDRILSSTPRLSTRAKQRRAVAPFLDGMADRLRQRIRAMRQPDPTGTGLVVLHKALIEQAMRDAGLGTEARNARGSRDFDRRYQDGLAAADRVGLHNAVRRAGVIDGYIA